MTQRITLALSLSLALLAGCTTGVPVAPDGGSLPVDAGRRDDAQMPDDPDAGPPPECTDEGRGATIGEVCARQADCDDHCFCNGVERCTAGICEAGPVSCAGPACATATCEEGRGCVYTADDAMCDDGEPCNGAERCDVRSGCRASAPPTCNDANACTIDACEPGVGCVFELTDGDGDGDPSRACGGTDCNDANPLIGPSAAEVCGNGLDDDCNGMIDVEQESCRPTNDACASALDITPSALGTFRHRGTTEGFTSHATLGCTASSTDTRRAGPDAVYTFTLDAMRDVTLQLEGIGSGGGLILREGSSCESGPDLKCIAPTSSTVDPLLRRRRLPAGDYAVIVKMRTVGPFTLLATFAEATAVQSDTCGADTLDISAGGTFTGSLEDNDYQLSCHTTTSSSYVEAAHRLVVPAGEFRDARITATVRTPTGSASTPYLELTSECGATSGASYSECNVGTSSVPGELFLRGIPGGTYYVLVETASTTAGTGTYTLTAELTPSSGREAGDSCDPGVPVVVTEAAPGTIELEPLDAPRDTGEFCGANRAGYRDAFFTFTLAETRDVVVRTSSTARHWVGLSSTCGVVESSLDCMASASGVAERRFVRLAAGTYFLNVSSVADTGAVQAQLATFAPTPAPPNDTCDGASPIEDGTPLDVLLPSYTDDVLYACGGEGALDAYYTFTLATPRFVTLRAEGATSMALLTGACTAGASFCVTGSPPQILETLEAGTYYVVVESPPLDAISVRLRFTTAAP